MANHYRVISHLIFVLAFLPMIPAEAGPQSISPDALKSSIEKTRRITEKLLTDCKSPAPDAAFHIPESFVSKSLPSGSGFYGYRDGCPYWIVDFTMNSKSNTAVIDGKRVKYALEFDGSYFDLPSSALISGNSYFPVVKEDCNRLLIKYLIYTRMNHESANAFVEQRSVTNKGFWNDATKSCNIGSNVNDRFTTKAPDANLLVIRVATQVKLRSSWQEAQSSARNFLQ